MSPVSPEIPKAIPKLEFNLLNLLSVGIALSKEAGDKIVQIKKSHGENAVTKGITKEGAQEPLTVADTESNSILVNGFITMFENQKSLNNENGNQKNKLKIVSEETNPDRKDIVSDLAYIDETDWSQEESDFYRQLLDPNDIYIIIDPLDATQEFKEGTDKDGKNMLHYVSTLICFVKDGKPIAGVLNRPFVDEEPIWGVPSLNQLKNVQNYEKSEDKKKKIALSRSHRGEGGNVVEKYLREYEAQLAGGSGYKSFLVLTGKVDAYIHVTAIKVWDVCAGHALLKAAGGDITDKDGNTLEYKDLEKNYKFENGLIASKNLDEIKQISEKLKDVIIKA